MRGCCQASGMSKKYEDLRLLFIDEGEDSRAKKIKGGWARVWPIKGEWAKVWSKSSWCRVSLFLVMAIEFKDVHFTPLIK